MLSPIVSLIAGLFLIAGSGLFIALAVFVLRWAGDPEAWFGEIVLAGFGVVILCGLTVTAICYGSILAIGGIEHLLALHVSQTSHSVVAFSLPLTATLPTTFHAYVWVAIAIPLFILGLALSWTVRQQIGQYVRYWEHGQLDEPGDKVAVVLSSGAMILAQLVPWIGLALCLYIH